MPRDGIAIGKLYGRVGVGTYLIVWTEGHGCPSIM